MNRSVARSGSLQHLLTSKQIHILQFFLLDNRIIGENICLVFSNSHVMLEVYGGLSIFRPHCPAIIFGIDFSSSEIDHWLNSEHHSFFEFWSVTLPAIIGNLWILVHAPAEAVTHEFSHHTIT